MNPAFFLTYKTVIKFMALAALIFSVTTRADATAMNISFDDGGNNTGCGVIDVENGYAVCGEFIVTVGLAAGDWTLAGGTPSAAGSGASPNGYFNYDNMVSLDSDPYLTTTGGLLFTNSAGDQLNIWAEGPDTYSMWAVSSDGTYYVEAGVYPNFPNATSCGSSTITNNPAVYATLPSAPALSIQPAANGVMLLWPVSGTTYRLLQNIDCCSTNWIANTNTVSVVNGTNQVMVPSTSGKLNFRLVSP
ncbi:MAG TPA: hypothetical protein VGN23_05465 [Verrucomicrobiae bacterium]